jgi:hypothetical protein
MNLVRSVKYRGLLALLLLCLGGMVWLQGEHIHPEADKALGGECLVCHLGTAATAPQAVVIVLPEFVEQTDSHYVLQSIRQAGTYRPPARASPAVV